MVRQRILTALPLLALFAVDGEYPRSCLADPIASPRIEVPQHLPPHPRVFLNQQEIDRLKEWIAREPWLRDYVDKFLVAARANLANIPVPLPTVKDRENAAIAITAHEYAIAYVLSGERPFAQAAAQILLSYVPIYEAYTVTETKGKALPSTLNEARWAVQYASAYDLIYNSGVLSDKDKQAIESRVLRPCGEVLRICNHKWRSNWRARALAGIGVVGFCIDDRSLIDEALHGFRDKQGKLVRNGFVHHIAQSVLADGIFYERSFGYQAYTADSYFLLMEAARHSGVDLWNHETTGHSLDAGSDVERTYGETGSKSIKPLFDALFFRTFSDGAVSVVADASLDHFRSWRYYDAAWRAWRDPKYAFASRIPPGERRPWEDPPLSDTARLRSPTDLIWLEPDLPPGNFTLEEDATIGRTGIHKNACTLFPNGGYAILRQSTDPGAVCVEMNFGCWGSGHSHPDKLSIVVSDGSRKVIREVTYFGYGDQRHLTWDRQTIAHNTVTVDQISQAPQGDGLNAWPVPPAGQIVRGRPLLFYPGKRLKVFRAECVDAYDGVRLERTVVLVGSTVVDFFLCRSDQQHIYDYALHIDGKIVGKQAQEPGPLSEQFGYRDITDLQRLQAPCAIEISPHGTIQLLTDGNVTTGMGIAGKNGQQRPVVVVRQEGKNALYVSSILFDDSQKTAMPRAVKTESEQRVELPGGLVVLNYERGVSLLDAEGTIIEQAFPPGIDNESLLEP